MDEQITTGQVAKKWGLIYGLVTTLMALIPLILEMQTPWMVIVNIAMAILFFVLANNEFKKANGGYMTFGDGFKISIVAALICAVMRNVINYVYLKFVDPGVSERIQDVVENTWREQGMTEAEIDRMSGFAAGITNPEIGLAVGIVFVMLGGLIWGAIVSAIIKNEAEDF